ncbi:hypothetical protein DFJ58DRAFT_735266 [Suillus subalutaceus]|uniref:uncharacterized protein n=1 Tax=Suillus subalutaceus TaxID=48586 RepID=UPI001B85CD4F|nr:uncharacterized protein DFJ58DRAFT_735266 [Suillus subalutaceus]KAG1836053.1 hypothetical protein DFJ58DRAFT_735266 [Suillus subalutaceus]
MSQHRCAGRPTKRPRLVKHTQTVANAPDQVQRHRIFSLQPTGQISLRTSYIPANITDDLGESASDPDPWNKVEHSADTNLPFAESEVLRERHQKNSGLQEWQTYIDEFIRLEGRGKNSGSPFELACCSCTIQLHVNAPLHRIKQWKDGFFHPVSLKSMGLCMQLGHYPLTTCRKPKPAYNDDFVVVDIHGIHEIDLDFCGCEHEVSHFKQLLRARWFPATVTNPRTAATFAVLEFFHLLSFKSKVSAYEFYHCLARWTDNTGITPIRVSLLSSSSISLDMLGLLQFRIIIPSSSEWLLSVHSTRNGNLAVLCPACPHPGKNLPDGCELEPNQWKYGLFIVVDANFRLKRQMVSSDEKDPGLSQGWSFFVDERDYKYHLNAHTGIAQEKAPASATMLHCGLRAEIKAWEMDHSQPNPFQSRVATMTQAAVRLELAKQDAKELEDGLAIPLHAEVTCSVLLSTGIDLEHTQRRLRVDASALGQHSTEIQRTKILTRRTALQRRLDAWTAIQTVYMPMVPNLRTSATLLPHNDITDDSGCPTSNPNSSNAEDLPLLLPSEVCGVVPCDQKMLEMEWSLRYAQANDALNECRTHIRVRRQLYQYKTQHVRGQGASTHSQKTLDAIEERLMLSHAKYVSAHKALVSLAHHLNRVGWEQKLQPLKKAHLRPMGDFGALTQGTDIMSLIWLTHGISADNNEGLQDSLRMEWCKARAHHNRWSEEILLLLEEMERVLRFLDWQAAQWDSLASRPFVEPLKEEVEEGFVAYAFRQVHIRHRLAAVFKESWRTVPDLVASGLDADLLVEEDDGPSLDEPPCEDVENTL